MKSLIAIWACIGTLVALFWALYFAITHHNLMGTGGAGWVLLCLSCPIALVRHHPVSLYLVLAANAATYALAGVVVESVRRLYRLRSVLN